MDAPPITHAQLVGNGGQPVSDVYPIETEWDIDGNTINLVIIEPVEIPVWESIIVAENARANLLDEDGEVMAWIGVQPEILDDPDVITITSRMNDE